MLHHIKVNIVRCYYYQILQVLLLFLSLQKLVIGINALLNFMLTTMLGYEIIVGVQNIRDSSVKYLVGGSTE